VSLPDKVVVPVTGAKEYARAAQPALLKLKERAYEREDSEPTSKFCWTVVASTRVAKGSVVVDDALQQLSASLVISIF